MHKRILCVLLTALILLSLIPAMALPTQAASNMKTGERCIAILKEMEGFVEFPIYDNGQYSVGYGSRCDKDDYPDGITEEEADQLLRQFLASMEKSLNDFANRNGILFSQHQFDALMLFTYNCGPNWVNGDGEFCQAVLGDVTGNMFIYYITQWTVASGQLHTGLINRRLIEADMYLNGSYTNIKPSNYTYVLYNNNEGVSQVRVQGYDSNLIAHVQPVPTRDGYKFLGWYTAAQGGKWVTKLTAGNAGQTLYAHWQAANAAVDAAPEITYAMPVADLVSATVYDKPNGTKKGSLREDSVTVIRAEFLDGSGVKWGKLSAGNWVKLGDPRKGAWEEVAEDSGVKVTVTGDYVNVRTGPGTEYNVVSGVLENDEIVITQVCDVNGVLWGRFRGGWICLQYTDYSGGLPVTPKPEQSPEQSPEQNPGQNQEAVPYSATGTVTVNQLNIRATAGTHGYVLGCYSKGDKVKITEKALVGNVPWGRTDKGWICLTYVKLDTADQTPETTEPETTAPESTPAPDSGEQNPGSDSAQGIPATVISRAGLNIRAGAGTNFACVGSYKSGEKISILEQKTVGGITWGRTDKGWVSMQYVKIDDVWANTSGVYGIVISAGGLNVRSGPGVGYAPVGAYRSGQRIVILEQTVAGGQKWGRTDLGWVCMAYVRLENAVGGDENQQPAPDTTRPEESKPENNQPDNGAGGLTGIVTAGALNIRSTPGTKGAIVGSYRSGDKVTILEKTTVNGTAWGRTDKGWICLAYVKMDAPAAPEIEAGDTVVIDVFELCIRKGPGTGNAIVGSYKRGQTVTILELAKVGTVSWGRTDKGWICLDYVHAVAAPEVDENTENTEPDEEVTTETTEPDKEETTEPTEQPGTEGENPDEETEETTAPETTEPDVAFDFTYEEYVTALNAELADYDIVAKSVDSGEENTRCYEFVAPSDGGSYGVMMYVELARDGKKVVGVLMVCDVTSEPACENLSVFATYAMMIVDDSIAEADLEAMMSDPQVDEDGNQYFIMQRRSGDFAFIVTDTMLQFYMAPVGA